MSLCMVVLVQVIHVVGFKLAKDGSAMDGNTIGTNQVILQNHTFRFRNATDTHAEED